MFTLAAALTPVPVRPVCANPEVKTIPLSIPKLLILGGVTQKRPLAMGSQLLNVAFETVTPAPVSICAKALAV